MDGERDFVIDALQNDNKRLRRLLEEQGALLELRHRLRNTISMLRQIIRRTVDGASDVQDYAAQMDDRFDVITRVQTAADIYGWVELRALIDDELFNYRIADSKQITISGPTIRFQPKVGQLLALAIHELVVNSVARGGLGGGDGTLDLHWAINNSSGMPVLELRWTENCEGAVSSLRPSGFSEEILTGLLEYELSAKTTLAANGGSLNYEITMAWSDRIGTTASSN